ILIYLTIGKLFGQGIGDRPILFLGMLLIISGFQIFLTGLLEEKAGDLLFISLIPSIPDKMRLKVCRLFASATNTLYPNSLALLTVSKAISPLILSECLTLLNLPLYHFG
ncbi:MAG: hypothetical protein M1365_16135, partial [Actinobacteria bacterium]|nr:hypothetical protein [Actinomycetota bacterium]